MALKRRENFPTVKPVPFFERYSPRMSMPPLEPPHVSIRPLEKPTRIPPTMQLVSRSGMIGCAGTGMIDIDSEFTTVQIVSRRTNVRPSVLYARSSNGTLLAR